MSSGLNFYPPTIYFNDINFNNDFYAIPNNNQGISLAYANTHFLFSTGVANSTATSTFFAGSVGVGAIASGLAGDMNAMKYLINGINISNIFVASNVLSDTSNLLNNKINTKEDILTFNTPFSRVNNTISLLYDSSLTLDGTGKLSVAASTNSSKWTSSGTNIFNNNTGNVGIGSQIPSYKLDVSGDVNAVRYLLAGNDVSNIFVSSNVLSNINLNSGFLNSNITTQQFIPSLNTNQLKLNNNDISNIINTASNTNYVYSSNNSNSLFGYTSNTSNSNYVYSSNNIDRFNIFLPNTKFWYDPLNYNGVSCYDLNIEKYVPSSNLGGGYKARSFRITTIVPVMDWRTEYNLYFTNGEYINYPETLTIHMNNNSNDGGFSTANDNYANGIILGKTKQTNLGYWNFVPDNYNYIRYITKIGWDTNVIIERLLP